MNKKIIAKEVNPYHIDFSFYFEDDGLKSIGGENCACYIPAISRGYRGFNDEEYKEIVEQADRIIEGFSDVSDKWTNGYDSYATYKEVMEYNGLNYSSTKCHALKEWAENTDTNNTDCIAEYLTITTGERWNVRSFCGYSQGDYCEVLYCTAHYSEEHITEIGKFWLGCGTEFSIDNCYGYYVVDDIRWREGETLKNYLADLYGCKPEDLEIHLYDGEHSVTDYKLLA